ncbi:S-adenosyl-L-methionine-dependent methyltransferase [Syncephalis fuscata]|nr:S-adenosyl-L-methionine-dependent methyltransferase [Syncephalis fuscata]
MRSKGWRKRNVVRKPRDAPNGERGVGYKELEKSNPVLESYYKEQNVVPEEEWESFLTYLRTELPTTFRVTGTRKVATELNENIKKKYIPILTNITIDDKPVEAPTNLPWYPNGFGWQLLSSKMAVKRSPEFKQFHQFLVAETEVGNISRQEAVSMIPPLLLDVEPHHLVLDMCAAPGSKTAQLVEAIHANDTPGVIPAGVVVANDVDARRAYMLVHQMRRLQSPSLVVTNHEAQHFPNIQFDLGLAPGDKSKLQFDRVLCDVPCSGDGTLRKNAIIWQNWHLGNAIGLHTTQISILMRGCQLLKVGGRLVYSTCSMNPVENESVVAAVLNRYAGSIKLVDVKDRLVELKRRPGLTKWKMMSKSGAWYDSYDQVPASEHKVLRSSLFPPANAHELGLEHCLRIYSHLQNTGAFFVAVFEKTAAITMAEKAKEEAESNGSDSEKIDDTEVDTVIEDNTANDVAIEDGTVTDAAKRSASSIPAESNQEVKRARNDDNDQSVSDKAKDSEKPVSKGGYSNPEGPFKLLSANNTSIAEICEFYGLSNEFPRDQILVRSDVEENNKTLFLVSGTVKKILQAADIARLKLVHTGIRVFIRNEGSNERAFRYRLQADGLGVVAPLLSPTRVVNAHLDDLRALVLHQNPLLDDLTPETNKSLDELQPGCCVLRFDPSPYPELTMYEMLYIPVWRARISVNLLLSKQEKRSLGFRIGIDILSIEKQSKEETATDATAATTITATTTETTETTTMTSD